MDNARVCRIDELKLPTVEAWRPWTLDNATQMAGYVTTYNQPVGTPGSFLFATIRMGGRFRVVIWLRRL